MNAYLGLVPRCHDSGGKSRPGHIARESRKLSRTILTQWIYQTIKATPQCERGFACRGRILPRGGVGLLRGSVRRSSVGPVLIAGAIR